MTGKEALNLLFCTSEGLPEDKVYECKKILGKELDELTKYKRAFEILEKVLSMERQESIDGKVKFHTLYFTGQFPYETYKYLEKEEYELLEELMSDER